VRFKRLAVLLAIAALGGACSSGVALAQTAASVNSGTMPSDAEPWRFNAASYGWAMNVSGSVTARSQTVDVNASVIDLLQKSDSLIGFMGYFEADKGRAGFYTDLVFARLGFGANQSTYRNPIPGLKLSATATATATYQLFIAEMGGLYEIHRWLSPDGSLTTIDGLLGFRYWNNSIDVNFDVTANVNFSDLGIDRSFGFATARSGVVQWVDPVLGLRLRHRFTPSQEIFVRGDIGGFGLGSQFAWQAVGVYSYAWQFTGYQIAALLGFRALGVNYSAPGSATGAGISEVLYGPIIGVSFRF